MAMASCRSSQKEKLYISIRLCVCLTIQLWLLYVRTYGTDTSTLDKEAGCFELGHIRITPKFSTCVL